VQGDDKRPCPVGAFYGQEASPLRKNLTPVGANLVFARATQRRR
jgi:hypothetical protein